MKLKNNKVDFLKSSTLLKISLFVLISVASLYLSKQWSPPAGYQRRLFFSSHPNHDDSVSSSLHPLNEDDKKEALAEKVIKRMGVLDENGVMRDDFEIGDFDPKAAAVESFVEGNDKGKGTEKKFEKIWVKKFEICADSMREYIPCWDNMEEIKKLNSSGTKKGERFERHCPESGNSLNCLIPAPKGYKAPISWPNSRDEVWFSNVPHTRLVEDKGGQNWVTISGDKFKFPGGGTQFIHGADQYLDQIEKMVPEIAFGKRTRVVLDVGCGVASFGSYLFSRDVLTFSIAPKDVHENQIQFALERGVPAMVAAFATRRLPYPSQAFDLIHCSRCRVNWTQNDGLLLLEANRILRAGGYFAWAAQPVYKHGPVFEEQWEEMVNLTSRLCWKLVKKEGYIAIWQKPTSNNCYLSRKEGTQPPLCEPDDDPDSVWYVDLKSCITRLPEEAYDANVFWPARLHSPPKRLQSLQIDAYVPRNEMVKAETNYWRRMVAGYVNVLKWKSYKLRNVLDMRAGFGGFAAALIYYGLDCWVLNVIPVGPNTLPVIYDRGLIGVMHDWCEPFDTYPRTYDLLNADGLFSIEQKRCNISTIMLEMDRILRPGGHVYIRDSVALVDELVATGEAIGWKVKVRDTGEGPYATYRLVVFDKQPTGS